MDRGRFWLRWSWRDLRLRGLLVIAIALVIALGTGLATGLGSIERWRVDSADASYEALNGHDLRVALGVGSFARAGVLAGAARAVPQSSAIATAEERLVVATQVDASYGDRTILTRGKLVGIDVSGGGPFVDRIAVERGRSLAAADDGAPRAIVEASYAEANGLPAEGELRVSGDRVLRYVGHGTAPGAFVVTLPGGLWVAPRSYGVVYVPLRTVQGLTARPGAVNELVVDLRTGVDTQRIARELQGALSARLPQYGLTVTTLSDEDEQRILYEDARNDQEVFNIFALLVLAGAAFAAFNLASRVVEAQRREIGIGMALGVPARVLVVRPLLMGAQIALLGAVFGVGVGIAVGAAMRQVLETNFPLPILETPLELGVFARGASVGFLLPLAATVYPVWRGVRVPPVEAIRVGPRAAKSGGLVRLLKRLPGGTLARMPLRNLLRAPRRTAATILAIAGVISVVIALAGMVDSFRATLARAAHDVERGAPKRVLVDLDSFYPVSSSEIEAVSAAPSVAGAEPNIEFPAPLSAGGTTIDAFVELIDPQSRLWRPELVAGAFTRSSAGIVLAEKAAHDLGLAVGDTVVLRHPRRVGAAAFRTVETRLRVVGLHPNPSRPLAFMAEQRASLLALAGSANRLTVLPKPGYSTVAVERELFSSRGVVSVSPATATIDALDDQIDSFVSIIQVAEVTAVLLALLIAFNSASIGVDERRRDYATMFAFGLPMRSVLRIGVVEHVVAGAIGTVLGVGLGFGLLNWIVHSLVPESFPEIGMSTAIAPGTFAAALVVGLVALAAAPLLTVRRLQRMDLSAMLRVVE
jgi:putative ABC transport system permease protein